MRKTLWPASRTRRARKRSRPGALTAPSSTIQRSSPLLVTAEIRPSPTRRTPRAFEARQQVEGQVLYVVHLAGHQGGGSGRLVGHHPQRDRRQVHALAAGEEVR